MSNYKSIGGYFQSGLVLANRSLEIFIISAVLALLQISIISPEGPILPVVLGLVSFIALLLSIGFSLSMPAFLLMKQQNKKIQPRELLSVTLANTRRSIVPLVLLLLLFAGIFILAIIALAVIVKPDSADFTRFFQGLEGWNPVYQLFPIISAFLVFTSIFFSLEKKGLIGSMKQSIKVSFKHLPFVIPVMLIGVVSYSLTNFLFPDNSWGLTVNYIIHSYIGLAVISGALFYYQAVLAKNTKAV